MTICQVQFPNKVHSEVLGVRTIEGIRGWEGTIHNHGQTLKKKHVVPPYAYSPSLLPIFTPRYLHVPHLQAPALPLLRTRGPCGSPFWWTHSCLYCVDLTVTLFLKLLPFWPLHGWGSHWGSAAPSWIRQGFVLLGVPRVQSSAFSPS